MIQQHLDPQLILSLVKSNLKQKREKGFQLTNEDEEKLANKITMEILNCNNPELFTQQPIVMKIEESNIKIQQSQEVNGWHPEIKLQEDEKQETSQVQIAQQSLNILQRNNQARIHNILCDKSTRLKYYDKNVGKYRTCLLVRFALKIIPFFYKDDPQTLELHLHKLKKVGMNLKSLYTFLTNGQGEKQRKIIQINRRIMKILMLYPMRRRIMGNKVSNKRKAHYLSATGRFMRRLDFDPSINYDEIPPF